MPVNPDNTSMGKISTAGRFFIPALPEAIAGRWIVLAVLLSHSIAALMAGQVVSTPVKRPAPVKVGLASGLGGLGDRSFNDMQYNGLVQAKRRFGVDIEYASPSSNTAYVPVVESLIAKGCSIIIAGGSTDMRIPVDVLSIRHPKVFFVLVDALAVTYRRNVASICFRQNEGSFLVGALSACMTKTRKIAFIGAVEIPIIEDFYAGFAAGAGYVARDVTIRKRFISQSGNETAWANPAAARRIALDLYGRENVDIIYTVASASGLGVFAAAREKNRYAVGVDSDQDHLAMGFVLTSMMKKLDQSIVYIIGEILHKTIENKAYYLGLKEGGVDLSPMTYTRDKIPAACLEQLEKIRSGIINGTIKVPNVITGSQQ